MANGIPILTWEGEISERIASDADLEARKVTGLNGVTGLWQGTQAEYDAIVTPDPNVVYIVV